MNKELKPVIEWFKMLPEPYRSQALEAKRNNASIDWNADVAKNILDALSTGFDWTTSEDRNGYETHYWMKLYTKIERGEIKLSNKPSHIPRKYQP